MKRALLTLCVVALAGFGFVAVGVGWFFLTLPKDIEPYDDAHLIRPMKSIPDEENAYTYYLRAMNLLAGLSETGEELPESAGSDSDGGSTRFRPLTENESAEVKGENETKRREEAVAEAARQRRALECLFEGAGKARCLAPPVMSVHDLLPPLSRLRECGELLLTRATDALASDDPGMAVDNAVTALMVGHGFQYDAASAIHYLVGLVISGMGCEAAQAIVWDGQADEALLAKLHNALEPSAPYTRGFVRALQGEYEVFAGHIDAIASGEEILAEDSWVDELPPRVRRLLMRRLLQPNMTKRSLGLRCTELLEAADECYINSKSREADSGASDEYLRKRGDDGERSRRSNPVGRILLGFLTPSFERMALRKCTRQAEQRGTMVLVALRRYKLKYDVYPAGLGALVPEFLVAVPIDPYDGEPMRYSRRRGVFWLVGEDLVDDGGSTEPRRRAGKAEDYSRWEAKDTVFGVEKDVDWEAVARDAGDSSGQEAAGALSVKSFE